MAARYTTLDVSNSAPGRYSVQIAITDRQSGQTVAKSTEVAITEEMDIAPRAVSSPVEPEVAVSTPDMTTGAVPRADILQPTARQHQDWNTLLRVLKAPEYVMTSRDSVSVAVEDTGVIRYLAGASDTPSAVSAVGQGGHVYEDMVYVPAGMFLMGSDSSYADEGPMQSVYAPAFYMDRYEVSNTAYKAFMDVTGYKAPDHWMDGVFAEGEGRHPVTGITWYDAQAYATWAGKRLPTEIEWEKAARGDDGHVYPWGDTFMPYWLNAKGDGDPHVSAAPVDSYDDGISPYGAFNMAGNVE